MADIANANRLADCVDDPAGIQVYAEYAGVEVRHPAPQRQEAVRRLHLFTHGRPAPGPLINPHELGMQLGEDALAAEHRGVRNFRVLHEPQQVIAQTEARHLDTSEDCRFFRRVEALGDIRHTPLQTLRIGSRDGHPQRTRWRAALGARHICRQFEIDRQMPADTAIEHPIDLAGGRIRIVEHGRVDGDHFEDLKLTVVIGNQMVHHRPCFTSSCRWRSADQHQRHPFGECPRHGIQNTEPADPVGHRRRPHAIHAGVAIGGIAGVQLVAVPIQARGPATT